MMENTTRELIYGKRPIQRNNPQEGESEWYYLDPRGTDSLSDMRQINVPNKETPNPFANEIQNYLYQNDKDNYKELYGETPPPPPQDHNTFQVSIPTLKQNQKHSLSVDKSPISSNLSSRFSNIAAGESPIIGAAEQNVNGNGIGNAVLKAIPLTNALKAGSYSINYMTDKNLRNKERIDVIKRIEEPTSFISNIFTSNKPKNIDNWQQEKKHLSLNGNILNARERINAYKSGNDIYINLADKKEPGFGVKPDHDARVGRYYVEKYSPLIEKYAKENNLDSNLVKSVLFNEAADYHQSGANRLGDIANILPGTYSTSIWPMNIQGNTWGDFQGKRYNVYNPEQNIALAVKVLKSISNSVPDKNVAKIATLWNHTGADKISDYGARTKYYYDSNAWKNNK